MAIFSKSSNPEPGTSSKAYIVITAFFSLLVIVGFPFYGLPFFYDFFIEKLSIDRMTVTSGYAMGKIIVAPLFGFIAGWLIDRYGPRRLMMAGSLMIVTCFIGLSLMENLGMFYLFYFFNALGYVCGGPLPAQVLISRWFEKDRGKAMGIAYLGIGTGGAMVPLIANSLQDSFGWQKALWIMGIIVFLVSFPLPIFIKDNNTKFIRQQKDDASVSIKSILKSRYFYFLAIGSMCSIGAVGGIIQHLKLYLINIDFTQSQAAHVLSLVLISSLVGRVMMGWLADLMNRKYVMILIYCIVGTAIPLLLVPDFFGRIYIFAVLFGIGLGGDYMIIPLMAGDIFGVRALGRIMGIILVADGVAESLFPMLVGRLFDIHKTYVPGFIILICIAFTGAVIISFLPKSDRSKSFNGVVGQK